MPPIQIPQRAEAVRLRKSRHLAGIRRFDAPDGDLAGFSVVRLQQAERELDELRRLPEVVTGTHVYFAGDDDRPLVPTGVLYCRLAATVGRQEGEGLFRALGLEILEWQDERDVVVRVTADSRNPVTMAGRLRELAMIEAVEVDVDLPLDLYYRTPDDELFAEQWTLENTGSIPGTNYATRPGADARVREAWSLLDGLGSPEVTIAVIDKGFEPDHPDLRGKTVAPLTVSTGAADVPEGAAHGTHGTPCASIAVAAANGRGIVGAAPNARLMPVHGLTYSAYLTERMFAHCRERGADIISCSWGTVSERYRPGAQHVRAIRKALTEGRRGRGCIVLFAVGNEGVARINHYATIEGVIAVGAVTSSDAHPPYANRGRGISVVAPSDGGWPVLAARCSWDPGQRDMPADKKFYVDGRDRGPYHKHFGGTSAAAPLVAGICALLLTANPRLTSAEVKRILEETADKVGSASAYDAQGWSDQFGYGRVNAERAVSEALRLAGGGDTNYYRVEAEPAAVAGFGLQIGAYGNYDNVMRTVARLKEQFGLPVTVEEGDGLHKIVVGTFASAAAAREHEAPLRAAGYRPFVRELFPTT